ncbi:MAG: energy transducer TonB [Acidobacteriota bacterium]
MPREAPEDRLPSAAPPALSQTPELSQTEVRLQSYLEQDGDDRRQFRIALTFAAFFHLGLLLLQQPEALAVADDEEPTRRIHVMETVRFQPRAPEPPTPQDPPPPKPKARKIPMPDPTPEEPEPIVAPEPEPIPVPEVALVPIAPPAPPPAPSEPEGPLQMNADIEKPVRLRAVQPRYTEIARRTRTRGTVILQTVIDVHGDVTDVEVLRGLPMGLTEAAVSAVKEWKFEPARLDGRPVAVYFTLTVRFELN